jgi:hypothetical protein
MNPRSFRKVGSSPMRTTISRRLAATAAGVAVLAPSAIVVPAAFAASKVNLTNAACPSTLAGGKVTYNCTLKGTGGPAKLTTTLSLRGSTITGTFTLKIKGKTYKFRVKGPIGTNKQKRVALRGTYSGDGKGTFNTLAPANKPTAPGKIVIKGTI